MPENLDLLPFTAVICFESHYIPLLQAINESLTFTMDVVEGKKKAAKNENEFIYHEDMPDKDVLPDVKGASLVKGIPFNVNDPEVSGPDIFARLVPMKAHEASSLYRWILSFGEAVYMILSLPLFS
jgi:tyrosine-protein phosphatase non-receptor type 23